MKKIRVKRTVRLRRWSLKVVKRLRHYLISISVSILVMFIVTDGLGIYFSHEEAGDIATRAAVVAAQVLEQGADRSLAESQAAALSERNLAEFKGIEYGDHEVRVSIVYQGRSVILKRLPWVKKLTVISASGSHPYQ